MLGNDAVVSIPTLGKLYPAHPIPLRKWNYHYKSMLDNVFTFFDLALDIKNDLPTNLPKISQSLCAKFHKIAPKEYLRYSSDRMYDLDLSLKDAIALAISCVGVISTRAGFCDIIAPHCKNLKIYYTLFDSVLFWSFKYDDTLKMPPKEVFIYDVPIYKVFLQTKYKIIKSLPMKLYKRYATKGFLRKLRLPFTAYFKIYRRHKGNDIAPNAKEMQEFIEQELIQTYEYQLGLALQKACERFWLGGFLLFPLSYLKIRKEKGKKLPRMNEFL